MVSEARRKQRSVASGTKKSAKKRSSVLKEG
jgi:hypothetical protein